MLRKPLILTMLALQVLLFHSPGAAQGALFADAEEMLARAQFEQVIAQAEALLSENPDDARLHYILGKALIESVDEVSVFRKLAHARRGRESLEKAILLDPLQVEARKELADYYFYAPAIAGGSKSRSARFLEQIREIDPYRYYLYRGDYQLNEGEWQLAKESYALAQQLQPRESLPLLQLGVVNRQLQLYEEASAALQQALQVNAGESMAYFYLGLVGLADGRFAAAGVEALERYIEDVSSADGRYLDQAHFRLGQLWQQLGEEAKAATHFRRAIELRPGYEAAIEALNLL